jgi:hypothetical protein
MASIQTIISHLEFGRSQIFEAIAGLSQREMTEIPIYNDDWTIKDVLIHFIGWDQWDLEVLPLIVQNRADEIALVERDTRNREFIEQWRGRKLAEVFNAIRVSHRQVTDFIRGLDHKEIDTRRQRGERIITIRSYVIELTVEHERQHALEIQQWRERLVEAIDPVAIKRELKRERAAFMAVFAGLSEAEIQDKTAIGTWSVKDMVGHVADWEMLMLLAGQHIYDPSHPPVSPVDDGNFTDDLNETMARNRANQSWAEISQALHNTQEAVDAFVGRLTSGDWKLRGPYPWPNDQGTLAELIYHISSHYTDHIPAVKEWRARPGRSSD